MLPWETLGGATDKEVEVSWVVNGFVELDERLDIAGEMGLTLGLAKNVLVVSDPRWIGEETTIKNNISKVTNKTPDKGC